MSEDQFTKVMGEKMIPTRIVIILIIIAWVCGFLWRGIYT